MLLRCAVIALAALIGTVLGDPTYVHPEGTPLFAKFSGEDPRGHGVNVEHCNDVHVIHLQDIGYPGVTVEQMVAPYQYAMAPWRKNDEMLAGTHLLLNKDGVPMFAAYWTDFSLYRKPYAAVFTYLYHPKSLDNAKDFRLISNDAGKGDKEAHLAALQKRTAKLAEGTGSSKDTGILKKWVNAAITDAVNCIRTSMKSALDPNNDLYPPYDK
ncbi:uncharacterized protein LOC111271989 [Varroa jacobsoni]|uniref:uncharacterized protein LOC111271989 n=1 Tax=Varroa jacobsoni TaxID=62625 RepID=UPI000BF9147C|nr:uncharacterized protein LOC111271989 [Varroa jacobsoni]